MQPPVLCSTTLNGAVFAELSFGDCAEEVGVSPDNYRGRSTTLNGAMYWIVQ